MTNWIAKKLCGNAFAVDDSNKTWLEYCTQNQFVGRPVVLDRLTWFAHRIVNWISFDHAHCAFSGPCFVALGSTGDFSRRSLVARRCWVTIANQQFLWPVGGRINRIWLSCRLVYFHLEIVALLDSFQPVVICFNSFSYRCRYDCHCAARLLHLPNRSVNPTAFRMLHSIARNVSIDISLWRPSIFHSNRSIHVIQVAQYLCAWHASKYDWVYRRSNEGVVIDFVPLRPTHAILIQNLNQPVALFM